MHAFEVYLRCLSVLRLFGVSATAEFMTLCDPLSNGYSPPLDRPMTADRALFFPCALLGKQNAFEWAGKGVYSIAA